MTLSLTQLHFGRWHEISWFGDEFAFLVLHHIESWNISVFVMNIESHRVRVENANNNGIVGICVVQAQSEGARMLHFNEFQRMGQFAVMHRKALASLIDPLTVLNDG